MSNGTRYTAAGRKAAEAARAARLEARDRRHAAMTVEEFLVEWGADYVILATPEDVDQAVAYHARLAATYGE